MRHCKGKCQRFKGYVKNTKGYAEKGGRYCSVCEYVSIEIHDIRCDCCGSQYRGRPLLGNIYIEIKRI